MRRRLVALTLTVVALAMSIFMFSGVASAAVPQVSARLTGEAERPGPGDPDGSGSAVITLFPRQGSVCFKITVRKIFLPAIGAHIHKAPPTEPGPVVVPLANPDKEGIAQGCVSGVDPALIRDINRHPRRYYVNVHTKNFPAGAVRGQLHH